MKRTILMVLAVCGMAAVAQTGLRTTGHIKEDLMPDKWLNITEATGDLNKDGIEDFVIVTAPSEDERPVLAIYWGDVNGFYTLHEAYDSIMPHSEEEFSMVDLSVSITKRGVLRIDSQLSYSAGATGNERQTHMFRYQDGDFYLIGFEIAGYSRYTGESEEKSYNYLTHKCKTTYGNVFQDGFKDKIVWSDLEREPLKRLGSFEM